MRGRIGRGLAQGGVIVGAHGRILFLQAFLVGDGLLLHVFDIERAAKPIVIVENGGGSLPPQHAAKQGRELDRVVNAEIEAEPPERKPEDVAVAQFVRLNHITHNDKRWEAWLYNRYDNRWTRLRAESGFDYFRILNEKGDTLVRGKVVNIEPREIIFKVDDNYYAVHMDQSLEEAMKKPLTSEQRKAVAGPAAAAAAGNGAKMEPAALNFQK